MKPAKFFGFFLISFLFLVEGNFQLVFATAIIKDNPGACVRGGSTITFEYSRDGISNYDAYRSIDGGATYKIFSYGLLMTDSSNRIGYVSWSPDNIDSSKVRLKITSSNDGQAESSPYTVYTQEPARPELSIKDKSSSSLTLSWRPLKWAADPDITRDCFKFYKVLRDGSEIKTNYTDTSFTDRDLIPGKAYTYQITAVVQAIQNDGINVSGAELEYNPKEFTYQSNQVTFTAISQTSPSPTPSPSPSKSTSPAPAVEITPTSTTVPEPPKINTLKDKEKPPQAENSTDNKPETNEIVEVKTEKEKIETPQIMGIIQPNGQLLSGEKLVLEQGKVFKLKGKAKPNSKVIILVYSEPRRFEIVTDEQGNWGLPIPNNLEIGQHKVEVAYVDEKGQQSQPVEVLNFTVSKKSTSILFGLLLSVITVLVTFFLLSLLWRKR